MQNVIAVGFVSVANIVLFIQLMKRLVPGLSGKVWLATSFVLGVVAQVLSALASSPPVDFSEVLTLVGAGLVAGLAAAKAYDELVDRE